MIRTGISILLMAIVALVTAGLVTQVPLFPGLPVVASSVQLAAMVLGGAALCLVAGGLVLNVGLPALTGQVPTGLVRVIVLLTFGLLVAFGIFTRLGFDVGALLTTSAIIGAVAGFAMQPTLGSLVSGVALSSDRSVKVGTGMLFRGMPMVVEELH